MKRLFQIAGILSIVIVIGLAVILYPRFSNMASEYGTGQAVREITEYVSENEGKWPASPGDLQNRYPAGSGVFIDYNATSGELIENPERLKDAVRPESGKFYTYPHYRKDLAELLRVLKREKKNLLLAKPPSPNANQNGERRDENKVLQFN